MCGGQTAGFAVDAELAVSLPLLFALPWEQDKADGIWIFVNCLILTELSLEGQMLSNSVWALESD